MQIIEKKLTELKPYENNPRNNDEAAEYVANSIKEFGFKVPIVVDKDGVIVAGHTRLKAAERLGLKTVPCIVADDLTPEQVKAFRLADNKAGEIATWDFEKLNIELDGITDIDMGELGFDDIDIKDDFEDINDEGLEGTKSYDHKLRVDNITLILTDEEFQMFKDKLDEYVDINGVTFGFMKEVLNG